MRRGGKRERMRWRGRGAEGEVEDGIVGDFGMEWKGV